MGRLSPVKRLLKDAVFRARVHWQPFAVPEEPHFDPEVQSMFRDSQAQASAYLEYGSGGSTLQADRLGLATTSVESDRRWAQQVRAAIRHTDRVTVIDAGIGFAGKWGIPTFRTPTPGRMRRWLGYVDAPFANPAAFYDLVLIDGRFRVACALRVAAAQAASGRPFTIIFDDYVNRPEYHGVEAWLGIPDTIGRAAIFRLGTTPLARPVTRDDVEAAARDWR